MPSYTTYVPPTNVDNNTIENHATLGLKLIKTNKVYTANANAITGLAGKNHYEGTLSFNTATAGGSFSRLDGTLLNATGESGKGAIASWGSSEDTTSHIYQLIRYDATRHSIKFTIDWDGATYRLTMWGSGLGTTDGQSYSCLGSGTFTLGDALTSITFADITGAVFSAPKIYLTEFDD